MGSISPLDRIDQVSKMAMFHNLNNSQLRVLLRLVKRDSGGGAWPSVSTIMEETALSRGTVFAALKELRNRCVIERTGTMPVPDMLGAYTVIYKVNYVERGHLSRTGVQRGVTSPGPNRSMKGVREDSSTREDTPTLAVI